MLGLQPPSCWVISPEKPCHVRYLESFPPTFPFKLNDAPIAVFQIGVAYAMGIVIALTVSTPLGLGLFLLSVVLLMDLIIDLYIDVWWTFEPCGDDCFCGLQEVPTVEGAKVCPIHEFGKCIPVDPSLWCRYIVAQILGGYVACLLIYVQYQHLISVSTLSLLETL